MTVPRLFAIGFIYVCAAFAWFTLGWTLVARTGESDGRLASEVALLWGGRHEQAAPGVWLERPRKVVEDETETVGGRVVTRRVEKTVHDLVPLPILSSRVEVGLDLQPRRKGLLWYDTYEVRFRARYRVVNPDAEDRLVRARMAFPSKSAIYDKFAFALNGRRGAPSADLEQGASVSTNVTAGGEAVIEIGYDSRGLGEWVYSFAREGVVEVDDFELAMETDFERIDFPAGTVSPSSETHTPRGWKLTWSFASLVTGQKIGMDLPERQNPGPLAARITFFAPVALLFFLAVMVVLGVLSGQSLHPINYGFVSAAFFSFHLLLAYLVDHLALPLSFAIASAVSVFLVVSYLRLIAGSRFAVLRAGTAQFVFLVLFSVSFFFEGYTGLSVTIGAVVSLYVLMQMTARVDWSVVFGRRAGVSG